MPNGDGSEPPRWLTESNDRPEWRVIRTRIRWNRFARLMLEKQPVTLCYNYDIFADDIEDVVSSTITSNESAVIVTEQSVIVIEDEPVVTAQDIFHGMSDLMTHFLITRVQRVRIPMSLTMPLMA